jgi:prepilin peptidase CpaA
MEMGAQAVVILGVAVLCIAAVTSDLTTRRIPNAITLSALALALAVHLVSGGWGGLAMSVAGAVIAGLPLAIPWKMGGIGGGDVKFLAAAGAFLGPLGAMWAVALGGLGIGMAAMVITVANAWRGGYLSSLLWHAKAVVPRGTTFAIALPLAAGVVAALWLGA